MVSVSVTGETLHPVIIYAEIKATDKAAVRIRQHATRHDAAREVHMAWTDAGRVYL